MHIADPENLLQIYDHQGELQVRLDDVVEADRRGGHLAVLGQKRQGLGFDPFFLRNDTSLTVSLLCPDQWPRSFSFLA
jgi:hypothetical protein